MRTKLFKILGVALPIMMVLTLALSLMPANTPTAEAAVGQLRFERVPMPKFNAAGLWFLAPDTELGPMAIATEGSVMYATANISDNTTYNINTLLKSTDGGVTWSLQDDFRDTATTNTDNLTIVDVGLSPDYANDQTLFVATEQYVYQSVDGGKNFSAMSQPTGWGTENITSMDVSLDSTGRAAVIIGTTAAAFAGKVYVYSPATTGLSWKLQSTGATWTVQLANVLAVAFSPNYDDDEGIFAVVVASLNTEVRAAFGYTQTGGGWATSIGDGNFIDKNGDNITGTTGATIAFPADFDVDATMANIAFVGFVNGTPGTSGEKGDVYKVTFQSSTSTTEDLNVRGLVSTVRTATNIWSIDVAGAAGAATILAGTDYWSTGVSNYYWSAYISKDSGATWSNAGRMSPTGGATGVGASVSGVRASVALSPKFATDKTAYAATQGVDTSALSRTKDSGTSWQQISLIDWGDTTSYYAVSGQTNVSTDNFLLLLTTSSTQSSLLQTLNGGGSYIRLVSYANEGIPAVISGISTTGDYVFLRESSTGKFWRSSDKGLTYPRIITAKEPISSAAFSISGADEIWTGDAAGTIWYTNNAGRPWTKPDESDIDAAAASISVSGNNVLVTTTVGGMFLSLDKGVTFKRVGVSDLSTTLGISITRDAAYATNKMVYGIVKTTYPATSGGVWRIAINETDPDSTEWKRLDTPATTYNMNADNLTPAAIAQSGGVLYVQDKNPVVAPEAYGGIWRATNPTSSLEGTDPPRFYRTNTGLDAGVVWEYSTATGTRITYEKTTSTSVLYYNRLMAMNDILASPVTLVGPANNAKNEGTRLETIDLTQVVTLSWAAKTGATSYNYQVANDSAFNSIVTGAEGSTTGQQVTITSILLQGKTYYWRVRTDAPLYSPWSETRNFSVAAVVSPFDVTSPTRGAINVPTQPVFVWTEFVGATGYEIVVSEDPTFAIIDYSRNVDKSLTMYKSEETLAYSTTYYWRVRPAAGTWTTGAFTTMAEPVAPTPPIIIEPTPPPLPPQIITVEKPVIVQQAIPDYLLWIIIVVGAVLVIALVVLIVRTRRVT